MEGFAWAVDAVVVVLIIISAYLAMVRGLVRELFALASWVVAFVAAFAFAPSVELLLPDIPALGQFLSRCEARLLLAFVLVFGASLIVTGVLLWIMSGPTTNSTVGAVDQGLGFVYGALRGLVLVAVVYIAYRNIAESSGPYAFVENAFTIGIVDEAADVLSSLLPSEMPEWFKERVQAMMQTCDR